MNRITGSFLSIRVIWINENGNNLELTREGDII